MSFNKKNGKSGPLDSLARERLLHAAERLFAEKGFKATSIRNITSKAGCNVAAVNYHFGGKEKIYQEVFQRHFRVMREKRISGIRRVMSDGGEKKTLEMLLYAFARIFYEPLLKPSEGRLFLQLMMREMQDPNLPWGLFVKEAVGPVKDTLKDAFLHVCPGLDKTAVELCIFSITGQLIYYLHVQKMYAGIKRSKLPFFNLEKVVDHIVRFSTAGIREYLKEEVK